MYVVTLVLALSGFEGWEKMFSGCVVSTVAIPILLWVFIWIYGKTKGGARRSRLVFPETPELVTRT